MEFGGGVLLADEEHARSRQSPGELRRCHQLAGARIEHAVEGDRHLPACPGGVAYRQVEVILPGHRRQAGGEPACGDDCTGGKVPPHQNRIRQVMP